MENPNNTLNSLYCIRFTNLVHLENTGVYFSYIDNNQTRGYESCQGQCYFYELFINTVLGLQVLPFCMALYGGSLLAVS